uniref:Uncharacterized protein n=1 Tax=Arundo donax TaxID=35708 RepID=A0A0A9EKM8_ARUDO
MLVDAGFGSCRAAPFASRRVGVMISTSAVAMRGEMGGQVAQEELEDELDALLSAGACGQLRLPVDVDEREREREISMFRSGPPPPTIKCSPNAINRLLRAGSVGCRDSNYLVPVRGFCGQVALFHISLHT